MKKNILILLLFGLIFSLQTACDKTKAVDSGKVLANINGYKLTDTKLGIILKTIPPQSAAQFSTEEGKKKLIDQLKQQKLLVQYAKKIGVTNNPEFAVRKEIMEDELVLEYFYRDFTKKNPADDAALKAFLAQHPDALPSDETFKARHILISPVKDKQIFNSKKSDAKSDAEAMKIITMLKKKLANGADFAELAKQYSEGPSAPRGGELGTFKAGQMVKPFEDALKTMKPGEVKGPVKTRFGYHLILLEEHNTGKTQDFDKLTEKQKNALKGAYYKNLLTEKLKELESEATITIAK